MNNFVELYMLFFSALAFLLMAFAVFAIGFVAGYKSEEKRIKRRKTQKEISVNRKEEKLKKEWKKFLEYDGSASEVRE